VSVRRPYWVSALGHLGILGLLLGLSGLQRAPLVVGGVSILLPPPGSGAGPGARVEPAARTPEPRAEPPPAPPPEEKKRPQPELNVVKEPDPDGLLPPPKGDIPSSRPRERDPEPQASAAAGAAPATDRRAAAADEDASGGGGSVRGRAGGSGIGVDGGVLGANAPWYLVQLRDKIAASWRPPASIGRAGEARASFHFQVHADGAVTGVESIRSSNDWQYDIAAQRAILDSRPLPPLPPELGGASIAITLTFTQVY
jgi:protein TonB